MTWGHPGAQRHRRGPLPALQRELPTNCSKPHPRLGPPRCSTASTSSSTSPPACSWRLLSGVADALSNFVPHRDRITRRRKSAVKLSWHISTASRLYVKDRDGNRRVVALLGGSPPSAPIPAATCRSPTPLPAPPLHACSRRHRTTATCHDGATLTVNRKRRASCRLAHPATCCGSATWRWCTSGGAPALPTPPLP